MIEARPYKRKPKAASLATDENGEAITEFYTTKEIIEKFGVSSSWVFAQAKMLNIPKVYHRRKALWSKAHCDRVFATKPLPLKDEDWTSYSIAIGQFTVETYQSNTVSWQTGRWQQDIAYRDPLRHDHSLTRMKRLYIPTA